MKKIAFFISFLILTSVIVSCAIPTVLAVAESEDGLQPSIQEFKTIEPKEGNTGTEPIESPKTEKKLPLLEGLSENGECFSWNNALNVKSYMIRIVGIDRVNGIIFDQAFSSDPDSPYLFLPELNEGEYLLLVRAESRIPDYLDSDWAVMEYRIGVEDPDKVFVDCHKDWSGFYTIFESTEDTEGLEARYCLTCYKTHVIRNAALSSSDDPMVFTLKNDGEEYSVRAHLEYTEKPDEEIVIPAFHKGKPVTEIEPLGFYRMLKLKTVVIPNTISKIGDGAFAHCSSLTDICLEEGNSHYKVDGGCLIEIDTNEVISGTIYCSIPNYITRIGAHAFSALNLSSIMIPNSIIEMGGAAFSGCKQLEKIIFEEGCQIEHISASLFSNCISLNDISLPNSILTIEEDAFGNCLEINSFVVPPYCNYIGEFAFAGWTSSQTVYIPLGSKAEADSKYAFCWDMVNRNCDGQGPNLVFLSKPKE